MGVVYALTVAGGDLDNYQTYKGLVEFDSIQEAQKAYPLSDGWDLITFSNMHALNTEQRRLACQSHFKVCDRCNQEMRALIRGVDFRWICSKGHEEKIVKNPPRGRNGGRKPTKYFEKV